MSLPLNTLEVGCFTFLWYNMPMKDLLDYTKAVLYLLGFIALFLIIAILGSRGQTPEPVPNYTIDEQDIRESQSRGVELRPVE